MLPLTENQILANIDKVYYPSYRLIEQTIRQPQEQIFAVVECTYNRKELELDIKGNTYEIIKPYLSLLIMTDYRWIRLFSTVRYKTITYREQGSLFEKKKKWNWEYPPKKFYIDEKSLKIYEFLLAEINITSRRDYSITYKGRKVDLVELTLSRDAEEAHLVLAHDDGQLIYELYQTARKKRGLLLVNSTAEKLSGSQQEDDIQALQRLKSLLDAKLITNSDYETKKADILSRM